MLETLRAALAAVVERDRICTERWNAAQVRLDEAKLEESRARYAMQDVEDLRLKLTEVVTALEAEAVL